MKNLLQVPEVLLLFGLSEQKTVPEDLFVKKVLQSQENLAPIVCNSHLNLQILSIVVCKTSRARLNSLQSKFFPSCALFNKLFRKNCNLSFETLSPFSKTEQVNGIFL